MWQINLNLMGLARIAIVWQQPELAACLLGAAGVLREKVDAPVAPDEQDAYNHVAQAARQRISDASFAQAMASGQEMTLEAVIAEAGTITPTTHQPAARKINLTKRELEVLQLLAAGQTDREIANTLGISHRTVNAHVTQILTKLGVHSRVEAATVAVSYDLVKVALPRQLFPGST